jgi:hypothetical protein
VHKQLYSILKKPNYIKCDCRESSTTIHPQTSRCCVSSKPNQKKTQQERGVVTIFVCGSQVLTKLFLSFGSQTLLHTPQYCFDLYNFTQCLHSRLSFALSFFCTGSSAKHPGHIRLDLELADVACRSYTSEKNNQRLHLQSP